MKKTISILAIAVLLCVPGGMLQADEYAGEMLSIGVGARAMAMGGAFVAVANDATAAYWNPAGLSFIRNVELSTIHRGEGTYELTGVGYDFFNCAVNLGKRGAWAVSYVMHSVGGIDHTIANPDASDPVPYVVLGQFSARDNAVILSTGHKLAKHVAVGGSLKYLWTKIFDAKATGFGMDLGVLMKPWKKFSLGMNVQDLGGSVRWSGTEKNPKETIPDNVKLGMAFAQRVDKHLLGLSFDVDTKYSPVLHYGLEYWHADLVSLRVGLVDRGPSFKIEDKDTSIGGGVRLYLITVDYAFVDYELVDAHYISVIARF